MCIPPFAGSFIIMEGRVESNNEDMTCFKIRELDFDAYKAAQFFEQKLKERAISVKRGSPGGA